MTERERMIRARINVRYPRAFVREVVIETDYTAAMGNRGVMLHAPIDKHGEDHFVDLAGKELSG